MTNGKIHFNFYNYHILRIKQYEKIYLKNSSFFYSGENVLVSLRYNERRDWSKLHRQNFTNALCKIDFCVIINLAVENVEINGN